MAANLGFAEITLQLNQSQFLASLNGLNGVVSKAAAAAANSLNSTLSAGANNAGKSIATGLTSSTGEARKAGIAIGEATATGLKISLNKIPSLYAQAGKLAVAQFNSANTQLGFGINNALAKNLSQTASTMRAAGEVGSLAFAASVGLGGAIAGRNLEAAGKSASAKFAENIRSGTIGLVTTMSNLGIGGGSAFQSGFVSNAYKISYPIQRLGNNISTIMGAAVTNVASVVASGMSIAGNSGGQAFERSLRATSLKLAPIFESAALGAGKGAGRVLVNQFESIVNRNTFFKIGLKMGDGLKSATKQIGTDIAARLRYQVSNGIVGLGASLFNTKNFGEADQAARRVETIPNGQRKEFQSDAQRISRELGYNSKSAAISLGQYQALSNDFSDRKVVNSIAAEGTKISIASNGRATAEDAIGGVARLVGVMEKNGLDGKRNGAAANQALDAKFAANFISKFQDISSKYTEKTTAAAIGKLLQPFGSFKSSFYEVGAAAAVASTKLDPERVNSGLPGIAKAVKKPTKGAAGAADLIKFDFSSKNFEAKGFIGFFEELNTKIEEYSKKSGAIPKGDILAKLFGGIQAGSVVDAFINDLDKVSSSSKKLSEQTLDNKYAIAVAGLIQKQEAFKNSLVETDIQIKGGVIGSLLISAFAKATQFVSQLSKGIELLNNWFKALDPNTKSVIKSIADIVLNIAGAAGSIVAFGAAWSILGGALSAGAVLLGGLVVGLVQLSIALAPIIIPLGLFGAAIYGISKAFGSTDFDAIRNAFIGVGVAVSALVAPAILGSFAALSQAAIAAFASIIQASIGLIGAVVRVGAAFVLQLGRIAVVGTIEAARAIGSALTGLLAPMAAAILRLGALAAAYTTTFGAAIIQGIISACVSVGVGLTGMATAAWAAILPFAPFIAAAAGVAAIAIVVYKNWDRIASWFRSVWSVVSKGFIFSLNALKNAASQLIQTLGAKFNELKSAVVNALGGSSEQLRAFGNIAASVFGGIVGKVGVAIDALLRLRNAIRSTQQSGSFTPSLPGAQPGRPSAPPISSSNTPSGYGAGGSIANLAASIAAEQAISATKNTDKTQNNQAEKTVRVNASVYYPGGLDVNRKPAGEGDIEGKEIGSRRNKLTSRDLGVAIPAENQKGIRQIPFGSTVELTNVATGLKVLARVLDAGPYHPKRQLDLTQGAANAIGFKGVGPIDVRLVEVPKGSDTSKPFYFGQATRFGGGSPVVPGKAITFSGNENTPSSSPTPSRRVISKGGDGYSSPVAGLSIDDAITANTATGSNPSNRYGARREKNKGKKHYGEDFDAKPGTEVKALFSGQASIAFEDRTGVAVLLEKTLADGRKLRVRYLHLNKKTRELIKKTGKLDVEAGQTIGYVGTEGEKYRDGTVTGAKPHLHLETQINGDHKDPRDFLGSLKSGAYGGANYDASGSGDSGSEPSLNLQQRQLKLKQAQEDLKAAEEKLALIKKQGVLGKKNRANKQAYERKLLAAENGVREAQQRVESADLALKKLDAKENPTDGSIEARDMKVEEINKRISAINQKYTSLDAISDRDIANPLTPPDKRDQLEIEKAKRATDREKEIQALQPDINAIGEKYSSIAGNTEVVAKLNDDLINSTTSAYTGVTDARKKESDALTEEVNNIILAGDERIKNEEIRRKSFQITEQQERENNAIHRRNVADALTVFDAKTIKAFESKLAPEDEEGQKAVTEARTKINAYRAETAFGDVDDRIREYERAITDSTNAEKRRSDEIKANLQKGDITPEQEARQQLTNKISANQALDPIVNSIQNFKDSQYSQDIKDRAQGLLDKLLVLNGEAAQAATDLQNIKAQQALTELNKSTASIRKQSDNEITTLDQQRATNPDLVSESDNNRDVLLIRKATSIELEKQVSLYEKLREIQINNQPVVDAIDEELAKIKAYQVEVTAAAIAQKKLDDDAKLVNITSKKVVEDLDEGLGSFIRSAFNGFTDLNSVVNNFLNKLTNTASDSIISAITGAGKGKGGGSQSGDFFSTLVSGAAKIFGLKDGGSITEKHIPNFMSGGVISGGIGKAIALYNGVEKAKRKEGVGAIPIVANIGEKIYSAADSKIIDQMLADYNTPVLNYMYGGLVGSYSPAPSRSISSNNKAQTGGRMTIEYTRVNGQDYVTLEQMQAYVQYQAPTTVQTAVAQTEQNHSSTAWRQQFNVPNR